jgi:hypothetical protein
VPTETPFPTQTPAPAVNEEPESFFDTLIQFFKDLLGIQ